MHLIRLTTTFTFTPRYSFPNHDSNFISNGAHENRVTNQANFICDDEKGGVKCCNALDGLNDKMCRDAKKHGGMKAILRERNVVGG